MSNAVKPLRLTRAKLLHDGPIYQETTSFRTPYPTPFSVSSLYCQEIMEIDLVVNGNGVHQVLNQATPCRAGDIFIVRPNTLHGFFAAESGDFLQVRRLWFAAEDWYEGELALPDHPRFCHSVFCDNAVVAYAILTPRMQNELNGYFNAIALELSGEKQEWREAVKAHLSMLLITVGRYVGGAIKSPPPENLKEWRTVSVALQIISEQLADCSLTLESISATMFISQSHLSRMFKKCTGEPFSQYLRTMRIRYACQLLEETEMTIEELVPLCGMRDLPTFYRSFHEQIGVTPNQYRTAKAESNLHHLKKGEIKMSILMEISENLQKGKAKIVKELVQKALEENVDAEQILREGLLSGMSVIGEKFKNNEVYVPEVLVAARAMNMGMQILKPFLASAGTQATGRVCIGTVQGDLHDIGKNLVKMMLEGKGFEVIDLGTDVSPETFVQTAIDQNCQIICLSALLTTTMGVMADVVKAAETAGIRDKVKIMIGGAPISEDFCRQIGADVYTSDAASAADAAVVLCQG